MSKKTFIGGLDSLLREKPEVQPKKVGRPKTRKEPKEYKSSSQSGLNEDETRATFIVNMEALEKLKAIAYWDRITIKTIVSSALAEALLNYEKKHGAIKPIPTKKKK